MTDINLRILLSAQDSASAVIGKVVKAIGGDSGLNKALAGVSVAAAGLAIGLGVEAVQKAAAFQNAMDQNVAHAGLAKDQFNAVSQAVLQMSSDVGQMPTDLAQGLYPILSGFSGITNQAAKAQTSLEDLRLASEDVAGTDVKTTVTSGALTGAFNALGLQTNNTAQNIAQLKTLNDEMEATVIAGNVHWDMYANVVGKLSTAIKGTGVSFIEANAALATMTNESFSAQRSQTYLANLFTQLDLKTDSLAKNAKKLGVAFDENKFKTMSLAGQLDYLTQITGGNNSEVLKLLNNNATALKTYNALESGMKTYKSALDSIKNSQGDTNTAFATASSSFQMAGQRMKATIDVLLIDLGTELLPILTKVLDWVTPLIKQFAQWVLTNQSLHQWLSNVGGFLQNTFIPAVQKIGQAVFQFVGWMQQASPAAQVLRGMLVAVGAAILALKIKDIGVQFFNTLNDASQAVNAFVFKLLGIDPAITTVDTAITGIGTTTEETEATVGLASKGMGASFLGILGPIAAVFTGIAQLRNLIGGWTLPGNVMSVDTQASAMKSATHGLAGGPFFGPGFSTPSGPPPNSEQLPPWMLGKGPAPGTYTGIHGYASGGPVLNTGVALVHKGEYVVPAGGAQVAGGSGGGPTINISINTMAGSRTEIQRMCDLIEAELAQRFRSQTGNYATGGTF